MNDAELESIRVRSEGALEFVERTTTDVQGLVGGLNADSWRDSLPGVSALGRALPSVRAARDRLEAMRTREGWSDGSSPTRALRSFDRGLSALHRAVASQLQFLGVENAAPLLEDAIVQLRTRAAILPQGLWVSELRQQRIMVVGALGAVGLAPLYCGSVLGGTIPMFALMLVAWQVTQFECPQCEKPFFSASPSGFLEAFFGGCCVHCGFRPR